MFGPRALALIYGTVTLPQNREQRNALVHYDVQTEKTVLHLNNLGLWHRRTCVSALDS